MTIEIEIKPDSNIDHTDPEFRGWLQDMLRAGPVTVTFEKADGTLREMQATLESNLIVETREKKTDRVKKVNPDVCAVWDVEKQEWRSFRWDKLRHISIKL